MTVLIATSVVRGSRQGESHGGVYLIDFARQRVRQALDWNRTDIDWSGRGWDRGLRGIAFDGERIYIAASDELFAFDRNFRPLGSWRNASLRHCHEIHVHRRRLYLCSTGFDCVLGFDLDALAFCWGLHISFDGIDYHGISFDPTTESTPPPANELHLNSVFCDTDGMWIGGLHVCGLLCFDGRGVQKRLPLPAGVHNARPFAGGVLFNDTASDRICCVTPGRNLSFAVPEPDARRLTHLDLGDTRVARPRFARGLCVVDSDRVAGGSSPSTVTLYDLARGKSTASATLSNDVRNAIHGLEVWPFPVD